MKKKQNRTTNKKKANNTSSIKPVFVLILMMLFIGSIVYSRCIREQKEKELSSLSGNTSEIELTQVITPDMPDAQMLHYPGFDVCFSADNHQPYYVTWILTPEHVRTINTSRSDNFRPDPDVPQCAQLSDYRRSGYDRGHMAPSADFRYDTEAQEATFFLTNMCPQHNSLNTGAWKNLEEQCRSWAERDSTLIIISGPILTDYLTESIGESCVTVPDRFFKVIYAPYANPPRAIGFIMPNQKVEGGVQSSAVTVDQVEEITGFDFFSSLPDELENAVESKARYSDWQYRRKK